MSYSPTRYTSTFGVSITDCTEVFNLNKYTPEEIVDKVFNSSQRALPKDQFKQAFKNAFQENVPADRKSVIDDCLQKVFDVCAQNSNEITPALLGRNISIFTSKPTVTNPVRDLFFMLDRNYSGAATEAEVVETLSTVTDASLLSKIQSQFAEFKKLFPPTNSFQFTYWDLYANRSHPLVQTLVNAHKQIQESRYSSPTKIYSSTTQQIGSSSPDKTYGATTTTTKTTYTISYDSSSSPTKQYTTTSVQSNLPQSSQTQGITPIQTIQPNVQKSPYSQQYSQHIPSQTTQTTSPSYYPIENLGATQGSVRITSQTKPTVTTTTVQPTPTSAQKTQSNIGSSQTPQTPQNLTENRGGFLQNAMGLQGRKTQALGSFQDFLELRRKLGFQLFNCKDILLKIKGTLGHIHFMSLDEFIMIFVDLFRGKFANYYEFIDSLVQIFQFIDLNGNGALEIGEVLQAFVHLFGGSEEDKIRAAFLLFDIDNSGFLDKSEVFELVYNTIKIAQNTGNGLPEEQEKYLYDVAYATTLDVFKSMDIDGDDRVSVEEFLIWYRGTQGEITPGDREAAKELREARLKNLRKKGMIRDHEHELLEKETSETKQQLAEMNAFTHIIDEVRKLIAFDKIHIHTAENLLLKMFPLGNCNYVEFSKYIQDLVQINKIPGAENAGDVSKKLFNALDSNKNGLLDLAELVTGLSLICGGSQTEKLKSAFDLFDVNKDKILDFNETCHFMEAFFKIMKSDTPYLLLANGDPKSYGYALAYKCFEETKTPFGYGLHFEKFNEWVQSYICTESE